MDGTGAALRGRLPGDVCEQDTSEGDEPEDEDPDQHLGRRARRHALRAAERLTDRGTLEQHHLREEEGDGGEPDARDHERQRPDRDERGREHAGEHDAGAIAEGGREDVTCADAILEDEP